MTRSQSSGERSKTPEGRDRRAEVEPRPGRIATLVLRHERRVLGQRLEAGAADRAAAAGIDPVEAFGQPRNMLGGNPFAGIKPAPAVELTKASIEKAAQDRRLARARVTVRS